MPQRSDLEACERHLSSSQKGGPRWHQTESYYARSQDRQVRVDLLEGPHSRRAHSLRLGGLFGVGESNRDSHKTTPNHHHHPRHLVSTKCGTPNGSTDPQGLR